MLRKLKLRYKVDVSDKVNKRVTFGGFKRRRQCKVSVKLCLNEQAERRRLFLGLRYK